MSNHIGKNAQEIRVLYVKEDQKQVGLVRENFKVFDPLIQIDLIFSVFEAFRLLKEDSYDCVVLDYSSPEIKCIEFVVKAKKRKKIPYIIFTKFIDEEDKSMVFDAGVDGIIIRQNDQRSYNVLIKTIRNLVDIYRINYRNEGIISIMSTRSVKILTSEEKWRHLIEMAPDGILTLDLKGTILSANPAFIELSGYKSEEIINTNFLKLGTLKGMDILKSARIFADIIRGKTTGPIEFRYQRKDGSNRWGEARCRVIKIDNKTQVLVIARDVTDRKKNDEKLKNLIEELERSNRELDDFTYAVSHDLKSPLRTIEAFSSFLLDDFAEELDETGKEYLERMKSASQRMKGLIDDLLLLSRVGRLHTETELVDLNIILQEIIQDFKVQIEKRGAEILVDRLPVIKAQRVWITQMFSNLINNGLKFNQSSTPRVEVGYEELPTYYQFSVIDNGIGIRKKDHEKIFRIFQRLHPTDEYPGTGVGLALCKKFVDSFGGKIWVESKPGAGSIFYFTYPKENVDESDVPKLLLDGDQTDIDIQEDSQSLLERIASRIRT